MELQHFWDTKQKSKTILFEQIDNTNHVINVVRAILRMCKWKQICNKYALYVIDQHTYL